jgi:YesN/AraC family two-component response regulator
LARVLVIDDDPGTLETFGFILRGAGHTVAVAATGADGLRLARDAAPDLILIDLNLPDVNGIAVVRSLRLRGVDIPFVLVTGFPTIESAVRAGQLDAAAYVTKPLCEDTLLSIVMQHGRARASRIDSPSRAVSVPNAHVARALQNIEEQHSNPNLTVHAVATSVGVSTEHLCRLLKRETRDTFRNLLAHVRLRQARMLLEMTQLSIKEVAASVGFNATSQLDRQFRARLGVSPRQHRRTSTRRNEP